MQAVDERVITLRVKKRKLWRDKTESYWLSRLVEEVGELASSLNGRHPHDPDTELTQIASMCINWLEMREQKRNLPEHVT